MPTKDGPWGAFNFRVEIDGIADAGFAEVSGLSFETELINYRNGSDRGNVVRKIVGLRKYSNITLKRGLVSALDFYQWLNGIADGTDDVRNAVIVLLDQAGEPVRRFKLVRTRIVKYTAGPFNAAENAVAMEELELASDRLEIE